MYLCKDYFKIVRSVFLCCICVTAIQFFVRRNQAVYDMTKQAVGIRYNKANRRLAYMMK